MYVFVEKEEKLSFSYPQTPLPSGALVITLCNTIKHLIHVSAVSKFHCAMKLHMAQINFGVLIMLGHQIIKKKKK